LTQVPEKEQFIPRLPSTLVQEMFTKSFTAIMKE